MDGAKEGIIYFCLGSNIIGDMLEDNFLDTVIKAFGELPYKVLLKLDFQPENVPANVKIQKWMPQQDILRKCYHCFKIIVNAILKQGYSAVRLLQISLIRCQPKKNCHEETEGVVQFFKKVQQYNQLNNNVNNDKIFVKKYPLN